MDARTNLVRIPRELPVAGALAAALLAAGTAGYVTRALTDGASLLAPRANSPAASAPQVRVISDDRWYLDQPAVAGAQASPGGDRWYLDLTARG